MSKQLEVKTYVDIKFSAHDAFLELPSSGTLIAKIFSKPNNSKNLWEKVNKRAKAYIGRLVYVSSFSGLSIFDCHFGIF
jgi:hypothetical protein